MSPSMDQAYKAMESNNATTQALLSKQSTEQAPVIDKALEQAKTPVPKAPESKSVPSAPENNFGKDAEDWVTAMSVLSGVVGAFSRQHATTAMNAFAAGVQGFKEGNKEAFDQSYKQWQGASQAAIENNRILQEQYQGVLNNRKLTQDEQLQQIQLIAAKYHDQLTYQAAEQKNMILLSKVLESQQAAGERAMLAQERLDLSKEKADDSLKEYNSARQTYATLYPVDPITKQRAPNTPDMMTWLKKDWPKIKDAGGIGDDPGEGEFPAGAKGTGPAGDGGKGERVNMISPDGEAVTVPKSQVKEAEGQGYKVE